LYREPHARNLSKGHPPATGAGEPDDECRTRTVQASATAIALMVIIAMRMRRFCSTASDGATRSLEGEPISSACTDASVPIMGTVRTAYASAEIETRKTMLLFHFFLAKNNRRKKKGSGVSEGGKRRKMNRFHPYAPQAGGTSVPFASFRGMVVAPGTARPLPPGPPPQAAMMMMMARSVPAMQVCLLRRSPRMHVRRAAPHVSPHVIHRVAAAGFDADAGHVGQRALSTGAGARPPALVRGFVRSAASFASAPPPPSARLVASMRKLSAHTRAHRTRPV
jgi:hypothetical protein